MWGGDTEQREFGRLYPLWYGDPGVRDRTAAVQQLSGLAARSYAPAQYALAMAYFDGDGVRRDYPQAYALALAAAAQHYPGAANMIGGFHGAAAPKHDACAHDPVAAVAWYRKVARRSATAAPTRSAIKSDRHSIRGNAPAPTSALRGFARRCRSRGPSRCCTGSRWRPDPELLAAA